MVITLVGNKCDLPRAVQYEEAEAFAKKNNCNYVEVSARTGKNINSAFKVMVEEIYKQMKKGNIKDTGNQ